MKKIMQNFYKPFLVVLLLLTLTMPIFAYETVIIKFPENMGWHKVHYSGSAKESLVQYVPKNQNRTSFREAVVYHSFKNSAKKANYASQLLNTQISSIRKNATNLELQYIKSSPSDSIVSWCASDISGKGAQCEILRSTKSHEGVIFIHYLNFNKNDFIAKKSDWLTRIRSAKTYYSYYRTDYVLNKEMFFEL